MLLSISDQSHRPIMPVREEWGTGEVMGQHRDSALTSTGPGHMRACWRAMNPAENLPLSVLKRRALDGRVEAAVHGQIDALVKKETRVGKPFWEMALADAEAKITLRAWSDAPAFAVCE